MSIYIGDKEYDLHYSTTGDKVNRSTFLGKEKVWPLYEFSFYDGSMQKVEESVAASGKTNSQQIRTCEDSWWHKLQFDEVYVFDQKSDETWLRYNATKLQCQNTKYHWLFVKSAGSLVSPTNSDNYQTISFSDNYSSFDGGTCSESSNDTSMSYEIDKNEWFKPRSGRMYGMQYDEWYHLSGKTIEGFSHKISPSDNNPTIFVTQVANSWGNNNQQIEFTCSSETDDNVTLTWKIYSNSTSGTTIYYGSNIASNNKTVDGDETYEEGKMWITTSNTNITLNNDVKKEIKSNGVVIWTMTATWSDNSANSSNCSHDIKFSGIPSSIGLEGATFNVSATCTQTSQPRTNTFTLNIGSKNNWRPGSATCECKQDGETITVDCCMSTTETFGSNCEKSVKIVVDKVEEPEKEYTLYSDKSSVGGENSTFTITSYYTQSGSSGGGGTVWAKCPDGGPIVSASYSQQSFSGDSGFVDVTVSCTGSETITSGSITGNTKSFIVSEHPYAGDKNAIITVKQNESGKEIKISHIAPPKIEYGYQYQVIICEKSTDTSHVSSVTVDSSTTSKTMYARLLEKCTAICEGEIVDDKSYDYKFLSKEPTTESKVTLNDLSFSFIGDKWNTNTTIVETDAVKIIIGGSINNDTNSGTTSITMNLVKDTVSSITNVCDANSTAFTFDFSVSQVQMIGGYVRTGTFTASYSGQSVNTNFSQTSSVSASEGTSSPVSGLKIGDFESSLSDSKNFEVSSISEISNNPGKYTATIKTKTEYNATDGSTGTGSSYKFTISEGSATTNIRNTDPVSLGVKLWQGSENTTINGESSRTVYATIKYDDKFVTTSTKTQYVCKTPGDDVEVEDAGITWSASEKNDDLYSKFDPKTGKSTKVYIEREKNINSVSKTITFTATLNSDTSIKQSFDLIWPKNNEGGSTVDEWEYQVDTNISLSTNCPATNIRVEVRNGTSIDFSIDLEEVQPGTTINNKSNKNKTSESSVTRDIYVIYGTTEKKLDSYTFTKTNWRYTAQDTKICSISETYTINLSSTDDQYICPGGVYLFSYRIQNSSGNNVQGSTVGATITSSNSNFVIGTPNYSDGINTVNINGSSLGGANTTITVTVGSTSKSFVLNIYDIYNVSIDNDKSSVSVEVDSGSISGTVELKYDKNGTKIDYSGLPSGTTVVTSCSNIDIKHSINTNGNLSYEFNAPSNPNNDIIKISLSSSSGWTNCSSGTQFTIFYTEKDVPVGLFENTELSYSFCLGGKIKIATISWSDGVCHSDYIEITNKEGDTFTITNECESNKNVIYAENNECKPENGGKKGTVTITVSGESKDIELISYDYWEISYNNTSKLCAAGTNDYVSVIFNVKVNGNYFTDNEIKNYGLGVVSITAPDIANTTKSITHKTNGQWEVRYTIKDSNASYDDKITASITNLPDCSCGTIEAKSSTNIKINQYTCGYIEDVE